MYVVDSFPFVKVNVITLLRLLVPAHAITNSPVTDSPSTICTIDAVLSRGVALMEIYSVSEDDFSRYAEYVLMYGETLAGLSVTSGSIVSADRAVRRGSQSGCRSA